ncbi:MAG: N-acetylmuramoyl-L-alanine amidase [Faecalibacterium sp.]|nr:N-acetylmuramoyl-L-alanine amidase [Faecalibacterium sp.]
MRGLLLVFAVLMLCFGLFLWKAALELNAPAEPTVLAAEDDFRPVVGDPPYRVAIDAGHGGSDPGARGVVEEKQVTAATAAALLQWLEQDSNYIPLQTREGFDATATPAQRAAAASAQSPQLLLSIHGNSAANGSTASGFECYPAVPGRTWHQESFYFARLLAGGMQSIGARLRGRGGVRYIYYLENDQKQLVENTYTQVRPERSFTLLEDVDCPAVLAEQCFVTNTEDVKRFGSEEGCKAVARIYYEAICAYFGTEPLPVE